MFHKNGSPSIDIIKHMFGFTRNHHSSLAHSDRVNLLLEQISQTERDKVTEDDKKVRKKRKLYSSICLSHERREEFARRGRFRHHTREGELINSQPNLNPYTYIPAYRNNNFIMPDRVFQKGKAGKRFFIKMKDTSVYSFKDPQSQMICKAINKKQKDQTIISRKVQQYNHFVDKFDGRKKNQLNKWLVRTRKIFNPTNSSDFFTQRSPMLEPKEPENSQMKKISLAKTHDYKKKWRPVTRGTQAFNKTSTSFCSNKYAASFA